MSSQRVAVAATPCYRDDRRRVVTVLILVLAGLFATAACAACTGGGGPAVRQPQASTPAHPTGKWYAGVLRRQDVTLALSSATQAASVDASTAALAKGSVAAVLKSYAADSPVGVHHEVVSSAIASSTVGWISVMCDVTILDGKVSRPIWDSMGIGETVRVGAFAGSRFMGEFSVYYVKEDPSLSDVTRSDGTYSLAERAAIVLLWDHLGRLPFEYRVTNGDVIPGSWVVARRGDAVAAVFLGDCAADSAAATLDQRVQKTVRPGVVLSEDAAAETWYRVGQAYPND